MNPTQTVCKWVKSYDDLGSPVRHPLPNIGGVELRVHRPDGKIAHYFCSIACMQKWIGEEQNVITDSDLED